MLPSSVATVSEEATNNSDVRDRNGGRSQIFVGERQRERGEKKLFEEIKRREFGERSSRCKIG
jgi:hypothetical protein